MAGNLLSPTLARASFTQALAEDAFVRAMLRFERALAEAQAEAGVIPPEAAQTIAAACASLNPSHERLAADGRLASSLAIPLVKALARHMDRASALSLVDDWCAAAVTEHRHLKDVAAAARRPLAAQPDEVLSLEGIVAEPSPALEEELGALAGARGGASCDRY